MLLVVDVGNTQTVLGLYKEGRLVNTWRTTTARHRTADEYRLQLEGLLGLEGYGRGDVAGVAVSSVVPAATEALRRIGSDLDAGATVVVEPGIKTGLPIAIDNPREVGADRVVNAVIAREEYGAPVIVVDFGTSTNFDVVNAAGEYNGGSIAPGLDVSLDALVAATAALRNVELVPPRSVIGRGTVEAIQSGLLYGHAGMVDGIIQRIRAELGAAAPVVATGGLAPTIVPHCRNVDHVDEFLTLRGLELIYRLNQP